MYVMTCVTVGMGLLKSENSLRCWSWPSTLFDTESLVYCCIYQVSWFVSIWGSSCVYLPCYCRKNWIRCRLWGPASMWISQIWSAYLLTRASPTDCCFWRLNFLLYVIECFSFWDCLIFVITWLNDMTKVMSLGDYFWTRWCLSAS